MRLMLTLWIRPPVGEHSQHPSYGWGFPPYGIIEG